MMYLHLTAWNESLRLTLSEMWCLSCRALETGDVHPDLGFVPVSKAEHGHILLGYKLLLGEII